MGDARIRALTFDVGGTVFRWSVPIAGEIDALARERGVSVEADAFAFRWRQEMFRVLDEQRKQHRFDLNGDGMHRRALERILPEFPTLELDAYERAELNRVWHRLPAWADFPEALRRLRRNYRCIVLTVMSFAMVVENSRAQGISWDGILSCEFLGAYKPDPAAYTRAAELLTLSPSQVMMVASHTGDLTAASRAGLATAYVAQRVREPHSPLHPKEEELRGFDLRAEDFTALADLVCE